MALPSTPGGAAPGLTVTVLDPGVPLTVVSAATTTGTAGAYQFTVQPLPDRAVNLQAIGAGAVPTTVTANLEASMDGGTTFQAYGSGGTGLALVATSVGTEQQVKNVVGGAIYRVNITTLTLGSATSVSIIASLS